MKHIVAYFDILGYKEFCKSNPTEEKALEIFKIIKEAPRLAIPTMATVAPNSQIDDKNRFKYLVFSDTIIISVPIDIRKPLPSLHKSFFIGITAMHVGYLMFKDGLPLRGAIALGDFVFSDTCIAGNTVVEAHEISELLDFSGIIFDESLFRQIAKWEQDVQEEIGVTANYPWDKFFPFYECPLKQGSEIRRRIVDWYGFYKKTNEDPFELVKSSFCDHGKPFNSTLTRKIKNTAKLINFSKSRLAG